MKPRIAYLPLLAQAALAAARPQPRRGPSVDTLFSLPATPSWFENLAYRASTGTIVAARLDIPQIWSIDPASHEGTLLVNITETAGLVGITQLTFAHPETFVVASANFSAASGVQANSSVLWMVTFEHDGSVTVGSAIPVPQMGLINGITRWSDHSVLAADSTGGAIWEVELSTGQAAIALKDPTMAPRGKAVGVNGVHVYRNTAGGSCGEEAYVYFTSSGQGLLSRIPVSPTTAQRYPSNASVEIIADGFAFPDDFALLPDGSVFLATGTENTVVHVGLDGKVALVAGSRGSLELASSTACAVSGDGKLYVTTAGGQEAPVNGTLVGPGLVAEVDLGATWWRW